MINKQKERTGCFSGKASVRGKELFVFVVLEDVFEGLVWRDGRE